MGTGQRMMSWIADEYQQLHPSDINACGCVTENPFISAALPDDEATGRGVQYGLQEFFRNPDDAALAKLNGNWKARKSLFRAWVTGYHAAKFLQEEDGANAIAILERDGALLNENGLNGRGVRVQEGTWKSRRLSGRAILQKGERKILSTLATH